MDRNFRACFYTSLFLLFIGFFIISSALAIIITYTVGFVPANRTEIINDLNNTKWFDSVKGNSPEQNLLIIFSSFLAFGLIVSLIGFCILCCVNCGVAIYPDDKSG